MPNANFYRAPEFCKDDEAMFGLWAADEIDAAVRSGCVPITLGPLTIRAESMPIAALAALAAVWQT